MRIKDIPDFYDRLHALENHSYISGSDTMMKHIATDDERLLSLRTDLERPEPRPHVTAPKRIQIAYMIEKEKYQAYKDGELLHEGKSKEVAAHLNLQLDTFYTYLYQTKKGKRLKYQVYKQDKTKIEVDIERIKQLKKESEHTALTLASLMGASRNMIEKRLSGEVHFQEKDIAQLETIFNLNEGELIL